ncbi:MAG: winged helix-turn-helix transcriptional regulator [Candidatus Heimdallarchaeota archaeon]|nr:winged helix-turn-helix transcriptional regulator [Candidatus Heimdallarchaeota archaeon]MDH5647807.1 winged helix-turn-helix transcriptional regulator [Candidatus Heimdallarchaeota archaeon]
MTESNGSNLDRVNELLEEYQDLASSQAITNQELTEWADYLISHQSEVEDINTKISQLNTLIISIENQVKTLKTERNHSYDPLLAATPEQIDEFEKLIREKAMSLESDINTLQGLNTYKKEELIHKDNYITELNTKFENLGKEKNQVLKHLESLVDLVEDWKSQMDLVDKLSKRDTRFRILETLGKHPRLSIIQLSFTLGTSIPQMQKYLDELLQSDMIELDKTGKYMSKK